MLSLTPILAPILIVSVVLTVVSLWFGARLMSAPNATAVRAVIATLVLAALSILYVPAAYWIRRETANDTELSFIVFRELVVLGLFLLMNLVVIMRVFETTFWRAVVIWLLNLVLAMPLVAVMLVPLKLYVMEAYVVPTNAMAPAIIGWHQESKCPHCPGTLILSASPPGHEFQRLPDPEQPGICVSCRKVSVPAGVKPDVHGPDRILVNKLLKPERWDVIVFRYPKEPAQKYVMRLVGLPGEKVYIKEGSLWINDAKVALPPHLAGLDYVTEFEFRDPNLVATEEAPLLLGIDEYGVLGDFSKSSSDSRFWGPVPGANIEGVVCMRYWPMARWQVLR